MPSPFVIDPTSASRMSPPVRDFVLEEAERYLEEIRAAFAAAPPPSAPSAAETGAKTASASGPTPFHPKLAILSDHQAQEIVEDVSDKSREALQLCASAGPDGVHLSQIARHFGVESAKLQGVWSGITRVSRRVARQPKVELIAWKVVGSKGDYVGRMHPTTLEAFRRVLRIT